MDELLAAARAGLANSAPRAWPLPPGVPPLGDGSPEWRALLAAGAWAMAEAAARIPAPAPPTRAAAPPETLRPLPNAAAGLLRRELHETNLDLLPALLHALADAGFALPPEALPAALSWTNPALRAAARPILGARGVWLAELRPEWAWALPASAPDPAPADLRHAWEESATPGRVAALAACRRGAPAEGRAWLEAAWPQEKAEVRAKLLEALAANLGAADEAFLELRLSDRAEGVRLGAAALLERLPDSAWDRRRRERAFAALRRHPAGAWTITLPEAFPADWRRDGMVETPAGRRSAKGWWLQQLAAAVPPAAWERHLGGSLSGWLAELPEWTDELAAGWAAAAARSGHAEWCDVLLPWRLDRPHDHAELARGVLEAVAPHASAAVLAVRLEALAKRLGGEAAGRPTLAGLLPHPWPPSLADAVIRRLTESATAPGFARLLHWGTSAWPGLVAALPTALPDTHLEHAAAAFAALPKAGDALLQELPRDLLWQTNFWTRHFATAGSALRRRIQFLNALAP